MLLLIQVAFFYVAMNMTDHRCDLPFFRALHVSIHPQRKHEHRAETGVGGAYRVRIRERSGDRRGLTGQDC